MRWLVEVTSIGKSDTQSFCVESDSWQKALQGVMTERGGTGSLSSFSIELLEDGYRAVDPQARMRYVVKRAPDDRAADLIAPPSSRHAAVTVPDAREMAIRAAASSAAPTLPSNGTSAPAHREPPGASAQKKNAQTLVFGSGPAAPHTPVDAKKDRPSARPHGRASERPPKPSERPARRSERPPATRRSERPPPGRSERPPAADAATKAVPIPRAAATPAKAPSVAPAAPTAASARPPSPEERDEMEAWETPAVDTQAPAASTQAPAASTQPAPRTLPTGTAAPATAKTDAPRRSEAPPAKKSEAPPAKKPEPARAQAEPKPAGAVAEPTKGVEALEPPRKAASIPPVGSLIPGFPAVKVAAKREEEPTEETPLLYREYALVAPVGTTEADAERLLRAELERLREAVAATKSAKLANLAVFDVDFTGRPPEPPICALTWKDWKDEIKVTFPRRVRQSLSVKAATPDAADTLPSTTAPSGPSERRTPVPGGTTAAEQRLAAAGSVEVRRPSNRPPALRAQDRMTGDELLSSLFEAMHDLHFMRDSLDGGDFCLRLAHENFPCEHGVIHGFDMMKREFVTMCATKDARALLSRRYPEDDPLIEAALRARRSIVVADASTGDASRAERFRTLGGARSAIITPVMWGGRALGAIELVNPLDGTPFREDEGNAMSYIAEQFAEFIGSHGLVVDPQKILLRSRGG